MSMNWALLLNMARAICEFLPFEDAFSFASWAFGIRHIVIHNLSLTLVITY